MLSKLYSAAIVGLEAEKIEVETDIASGLPGLTIVGLPDTAVNEAKERVKAAIRNTNLEFPRTKITINLAPADLKKEGSAYDLPMTVGILLSYEQIKFNPADFIFVGELALDGALRHTNGILPIAIYTRAQRQKLVLPARDLNEAKLVEGLEIIPVEDLNQLIQHFQGTKIIESVIAAGPVLAETDDSSMEVDFAYVKGQEYTKRALEIAAAGGHNVLMSGPPGTGKTLLAKALPGILPLMTNDEILEVTKIYSISGLLSPTKPLVVQRPFRTPHHSTSAIALVGGGQNPKPGEISLAHRGVLFLDELPEFPRHALESLRQPLEDGTVTVARAQSTLTFPARFMLMASQNPCPCGYSGDTAKSCSCSPAQVTRYQRKVSGPLLDRIDLHLEVPRLEFDKLASEQLAESSAVVRERVTKARQIQRERFQPLDQKKKNVHTNSEMGPQEMKIFCELNQDSLNLLRQAVNQFHLTARAYSRLLKMGRTIADMAGEEKIPPEHIAETLQYRPKEK
ncbi:MAG: YifB family Mg chelatase-like AAA ATPase [Candidatus Magasanikbacteria bacterium]|nr:YifB family Mg chelatase-like AAA ATPase [Candidatus Magasanikbacteria bacterium]